MLTVFVSIMYSKKCDVSAFLDLNSNRCRQCEQQFQIKAGSEFTPNCGLDDDGSRHEALYKDCPLGTFNNGSFSKCKPCFPCSKELLLSACTRTTDTLCCTAEQQGKCGDQFTSTTAKELTTRTSTSTRAQMRTDITMKSPVKVATTGRPASSTSIKTTPDINVTTSSPPFMSQGEIFGAVVLTVLLCCCVLVLVYCLKKKKSSCKELKRQIYRSNFNALDTQDIHGSDTIDDTEHLLSAELQAAPLLTVLNDLDVVQDLVLLLDPESPGLKNTRHLASSCSLSFNWINYTYSMKDSKSPLVSVLETVVAAHPTWTVGHLAELLSKIGRNDAVAVLGKLIVTKEMV